MLTIQLYTQCMRLHRLGDANIIRRIHNCLSICTHHQDLCRLVFSQQTCGPFHLRPQVATCWPWQFQSHRLQTIESSLYTEFIAHMPSQLSQFLLVHSHYLKIDVQIRFRDKNLNTFLVSPHVQQSFQYLNREKKEIFCCNQTGRFVKMCTSKLMDETISFSGR